MGLKLFSWNISSFVLLLSEVPSFFHSSSFEISFIFYFSFSIAIEALNYVGFAFEKYPHQYLYFLHLHFHVNDSHPGTPYITLHPGNTSYCLCLFSFPSPSWLMQYWRNVGCLPSVHSFFIQVCLYLSSVLTKEHISDFRGCSSSHPSHTLPDPARLHLPLSWYWYPASWL